MSMQVNSLTDAQYETAYKIGKDLHNRFLIDSSALLGRAREWIELIYRWANRPKPKIVFSLNPNRTPRFRDDPKVSETTLQAIMNERSRYISEKYSWNIREWMYRVVYDQRYARLREVISRGQKLWASEHTSGRVGFDPASFYGSFTVIDRAAAWVADAYLKIDPEFQVSDFYLKVAEFTKFGLFGLSTGENECWALRLPLKVVTHPAQSILHSSSGPAVVWKDGYEQYYLYGILFPFELWQDVVKYSVTLKGIQRWSNMDRIKAALNFLGPRFLLEQCPTKLIHASPIGNKLYKVKPRSLLTLEGIKILVYACPSTGQEYQRFVAEWLKDADEAQAWRHGMNKEEYLGLNES